MSYSISKIAACLDFSEYSLAALNMAATIACKSKATLYIIHSTEAVLEHMGLDRSLSINKGNKASNILTALSSDIESKFEIDTEIIRDDSLATEAIVRHAIQCKIDLIVMGSYGEAGYRKGYLGTTAYSVIKYAPCPVLTIPTTKQVSLFKRPLFPVRPILTAMRHYSLLHYFFHDDARLDIFGYTPGDGLNEDDILELKTQIDTKLDLNRFGASVKWSGRYAVPQHVLNYAEKIKADLIILTPMIDASIRPFFIGPNIHHILNNARVPTLIINRVYKRSVAVPTFFS